MNKRKNRVLQSLSAAIMIVYVILLIAIGIGDNTPIEIILFVLLSILATLSIIYSVYLLATQKRQINLSHLINLEENLYGIYDELTDHYKTFILVNRNRIEINQRDDMLLFERFVVLISRYEQRLYRDVNSFNEMPRSHPKFFKYAHIYALYYLLENEIEQFKEVMREFYSRIEGRSELRIFNETFDQIKLAKKTYKIPVDLLKAMYMYYEHQEAVPQDIFRSKTNYPIDNMILVTVQYYYYEATENNKMLDDFYDEFKKYQKKRRSL